MIKEIPVLERVRFCDFQNCNEKAVERNENINNFDYCIDHSILLHKCKMIETFRLFEEWDNKWCIEKTIKCIEWDTFCRKSCYSREETYRFLHKYDFAKLAYLYCEKIGALKEGGKLPYDEWNKLLEDK